ncbi:hypothetical protein T265_09038 [Opisthorchis viverrini]|uniref:Uncharacterized protein n=1 Tax=Opisthorchis viverrini TaxID=6198 RepID=A0A075A6C4_OPIVI|nr:hypothetical protein T265_09038 [Opisthorchis viverrini]KER22999.1 hypothetical protein T265_09038 [Opisthorchis viverrini]
MVVILYVSELSDEPPSKVSQVDHSILHLYKFASPYVPLGFEVAVDGQWYTTMSSHFRAYAADGMVRKSGEYPVIQLIPIAFICDLEGANDIVVVVIGVTKIQQLLHLAEQ